MRLGDVNHEKADAIAILLIQLVERGNLPPEWWSSVAAEQDHHWPALIQS
jgi:hypothetical protein